jgi:hypothetical protein
VPISDSLAGFVPEIGFGGMLVFMRGQSFRYIECW